ncbi:hypothetical protein L21SP2_2451 [Salinispira pacifica]|uniref:Uncharacterized protein n=1 Tax=Salinispira pacifica TaxID=1307761 RepID=V5WJP8_9SPIO|nr:hypothetical protein L21SP2_2451 [Salinispira pacifica]
MTARNDRGHLGTTLSLVLIAFGLFADQRLHGFLHKDPSLGFSFAPFLKERGKNIYLLQQDDPPVL